MPFHAVHFGHIPKIGFAVLKERQHAIRVKLSVRTEQVYVFLKRIPKMKSGDRHAFGFLC